MLFVGNKVRTRPAGFASRNVICLVAGGACWAAGAFAASAAGVPIAPHRAVYDFKMGTSVGTKGPADARGRIVFELRGDACTGYSVNFRQATTVTSSQGLTQTADVRSATHEDADGKNFRFRIETLSQGSGGRLIEGMAEKSPGGLSIKLAKPAPAKIDLGVNVTFPMQQTLLTLAAARKGERVLELKTFDGSDTGKKVYHSLQIIGAPISKPSNDLANAQPAMKNMKRWRVIASNFDLKNIDAPALYKLRFDMWDNGISSNVTIDYGSFTLIGKMSKLELFPTKPCSK